MPTIRLGRDQTLTLDGSPLEGTRDFDYSIDMATEDVTPWHAPWASTLPISGDVSFRLLIYGAEDYARVASKINRHPVEPMELSISGGVAMRVVPVGVRGVIPIAGVVAWECTFKLWSYD